MEENKLFTDTLFFWKNSKLSMTVKQSPTGLIRNIKMSRLFLDSTMGFSFSQTKEEESLHTKIHKQVFKEYILKLKMFICIYT